jgi:hypothetical protein
MRNIKEQVKLVVAAARQYHIPAYTMGTFSVGIEEINPWCTGCDGLILFKECPVLRAAKELEELYEGD